MFLEIAAFIVTSLPLCSDPPSLLERLPACMKSACKEAKTSEDLVAAAQCMGASKNPFVQAATSRLIKEAFEVASLDESQRGRLYVVLKGLRHEPHVDPQVQCGPFQDGGVPLLYICSVEGSQLIGRTARDVIGSLLAIQSKVMTARFPPEFERVEDSIFIRVYSIDHGPTCSSQCVPAAESGNRPHHAACIERCGKAPPQKEEKCTLVLARGDATSLRLGFVCERRELGAIVHAAPAEITLSANSQQESE